jgi:hypothetical protein
LWRSVITANSKDMSIRTEGFVYVTLVHSLIKTETRQHMSELFSTIYTLIQQTHFKESCGERIVNRWKRMPWCWEKWRWNVQDQWDKIIFADESKVVIGTDKKVYIRCKDNEGWRYGKSRSKIFQVTIWVYICWHGVGPIIKVDRNINGLKYIDIIDSLLCPVLARHFLNNTHLFQDCKLYACHWFHEKKQN